MLTASLTEPFRIANAGYFYRLDAVPDVQLDQHTEGVLQTNWSCDVVFHSITTCLTW